MKAGAPMSAGKPVPVGLAIREAGRFELPAIARLHAGCFADGLGGTVWSEAAIAKILALPGTYAILAWSRAAPGDPAPLGFALGRNAADEAEILSLGVVPAARRGGIGQALVRAVLARAALGGARRLYLEVAEDNPAARALYGAAGFTPVGRRPGYYRRAAGPATALVFAREVSFGP